MKLRTFAFALLAATSLLACDLVTDALPELTLGKEDGIPPVSGSTTIDVPQDFQCGDSVDDPQKKYKVTTSGTADKCTFTFEQEVVALKASEYSSRPELQGAQLVKRVDIDVNKLAIADGGTGEKLVPIDLNGQAFGTTILTKEDLDKAPPYTKPVEGAPIDALKSAVANKQDIVIPIKVMVVVSMAPTPPAKIALDFDAQPNLVFGF